MKFSDLRIGDRFEFCSEIRVGELKDARLWRSSTMDGPWVKMSPRKYQTPDGKTTHRIGSWTAGVVKCEVEAIKTHRIVYTRHDCYLFDGGKPIVILIGTDTVDPEALFLMFEDCDIGKQLGFTEENMTRTYKVPGEPDTFRARESACKGHFIQVGIRLHHVVTFSV